MEEKILVKSQPYNVKKLLIGLVIAGLIISLIGVAFVMLERNEHYNERYAPEVHTHSSYCYEYIWQDDFYDDRSSAAGLRDYKMWCPQAVYGDPVSYAFSELGYQLWMILIPFAALSLIGVLLYLWLRNYELTVTDKRVYGKVAFGKRVDLPVDSVSATATISLLKGVAVSTSSGRISFLAIKNANEIYEKVSTLLIERQQQKSAAVVAPVAAPVADEADQLMKYKKLLDSGAITQEEFDAKKKQLLGL